MWDEFARVALQVGTAGWTIGRAASGQFPHEGSGLHRYAAVFPVVEINSSFHRPHRASTWQRWRDSAPPDFRFSVKIPKEISHKRKLVDCDEPLWAFFEQVHNLGEKLAVLLLQLPPKLEFSAPLVETFLDSLIAKSPAAIVCEPRNASWFRDEADSLLRRMGVARVAADPATTPAAAFPGGWSGLKYWRLHGSPDIYRSSYADRINHYADLLLQEARGPGDIWCIFDNTASSAAICDAMMLKTIVSPTGVS